MTSKITLAARCLAATCLLLLAMAASCTPAFAATVTVINTQQAWDALKAAAAGDVIIMKGADYGTLPLWTGSTNPVTIRIAAGETVKTQWIGLDGDQNLTIDVSQGTLDVAMLPTTQYAITFNGTYNVHVIGKGLKIHQADNTTLSGLCAWFRNANYSSLEQAECHHVGAGIGVMDSGFIGLIGNDIHDTNVDCIDLSGTNDTVVSGNTCHDEHPDITAGDHPDAIQWWNTTNETKNLRITNNLYYRGTGGAAQGIFGAYGVNVTVSGNAVLGPMTNGLSMAGTKGGLIKNNLLVPYADQGTRLILRGSCDSITVDANLLPFYTLYSAADEPPCTNVNFTSTNVVNTALLVSATDQTVYTNWLKTAGDRTPEAAPLPAGVVITPTPTPDPTPTPAPTVADLQAQIVTLNATITSLQTQLATANALVTTKQTKIDYLAGQLATANATITSLKAQIVTLQNQLAVCQRSGCKK